VRLSFESKAKAGYLALLTLLALAMVLSIQRLASVSNRQLAQLRAEEMEITLVQRLLWKVEVMVSEGRGYMLSSDPELLADLTAAKQQFEASARVLQARPISPEGLALVREVERAAGEFQSLQAELIALRQRSPDTLLLRRRFESELLPQHRALDSALHRLVEHKERALDTFYDRAEAERAAFRVHLYGLIGLITFTTLILAWYLGNRVAEAYREQRKALAAARAAVAARDEMMGIVAHDLRNPLGLISLKAAVLRGALPAGEPQRHAESIEHVARQMGQLIGSMLDATTIEAGNFAVAPAPCSAEQLLREAAALFEPLCTDKGIHFEHDATPRELILFADRERVLQILSNLIGNALKFTPPGGRITLRVQQEGAAARFSVSDTGPGVPPQNLAHVFERFWKDGAPGKRGTGLGLFIARGIVEAHGGRIWVENTATGAVFSFTLPFPPSKSESPSESIESASVAMGLPLPSVLGPKAAVAPSRD
jgi:signal transduction histidine kinase